MRKLREVLRLSLAIGLGPRAISRSCEVSSSTVSGYVWRARAAGLTWPLPPELGDDAALEGLLFANPGRPAASRPEPDWARIHLELRKKHVTKALLWEEYKSEHPDGLQYSQFCDKYARFAASPRAASSHGCRAVRLALRSLLCFLASIVWRGREPGPI